MTEWKWIDPKTIRPVHEYQLAGRGEPAAAYAYGLAKNRGFADGNKRTAWVAARLFLVDNSYTLQVIGAEAVLMVEALAAGTMDEAAVADWFRIRIG